jgi:hypothetical protein
VDSNACISEMAAVPRTPCDFNSSNALTTVPRLLFGTVSVQNLYDDDHAEHRWPESPIKMTVTQEDNLSIEPDCVPG